MRLPHSEWFGGAGSDFFGSSARGGLIPDVPEAAERAAALRYFFSCSRKWNSSAPRATMAGHRWLWTGPKPQPRQLRHFS